MSCSQTLAQQNAAIKAALVTLQKKLHKCDVQITDLQLQNEALLIKVSHEPLQ